MRTDCQKEDVGQRHLIVAGDLNPNGASGFACLILTERIPRVDAANQGVIWVEFAPPDLRKKVEKDERDAGDINTLRAQPRKKKCEGGRSPHAPV